MPSEAELFAKLDRWLEDQPAEPTIFEVAQTRDIELFAAIVTRHFRAATKKAVTDRLTLEAGKIGSPAWERIGASGTLMDWLSTTWNLCNFEQITLFGLEQECDLVVVRSQTPHEASNLLLEHLAMLIDIYQALTALLPGRADDDRWLRRSNGGALFQGASPIAVMLERGRRGIKDVRAYLWAQIW